METVWNRQTKDKGINGGGNHQTEFGKYSGFMIISSISAEWLIGQPYYRIGLEL